MTIEQLINLKEKEDTEVQFMDFEPIQRKQNSSQKLQSRDRIKILEQPMYEFRNRQYTIGTVSEGSIVEYLLSLPPAVLEIVVRKRVESIVVNMAIFSLHKREEALVRVMWRGMQKEEDKAEALNANLTYNAKGLKISMRAPSKEFLQGESLFVVQFIVCNKATHQTFITTSVPSVTKMMGISPAPGELAVLLSHSFVKEKSIPSKTLKRLMKIVCPTSDYAKVAWKTHPWRDQQISGALLPEIFKWYIECCSIFSECDILMKYAVLYGCISRVEAEELLQPERNGTMIFRLSSTIKNGIVLSAKLDNKIVHVSFTPYTHQRLLETINVETLTTVKCRDSILLPKRNLCNLFRAEGVTSC